MGTFVKTVALTAALLLLAPTHSAQAATVSARTLLAQLPVAVEHETGYDREANFGEFIDADRDGCDTRREVLLSEAKTKPKVGAGCSLSGGTWYSLYDGATITSATGLQIDHVVSLSEAWKSGAFKWSQSKRIRYANDLGYSRSLIAVSNHSNMSKGERGPGEWAPDSRNARCRFVLDTIAVKWRWKLAVDSFEKAELGGLLNFCERTEQSIRLKAPKRG